MPSRLVVSPNTRRVYRAPGLRIDSAESPQARLLKTQSCCRWPSCRWQCCRWPRCRCNAKLCAVLALTLIGASCGGYLGCTDRLRIPGHRRLWEDPCARFRMEGDFEAWEDCMETAGPHEVFAARVAERFDAMCAGDVGMSLLSSGIGGLAGLALGAIVALLASKSKMFKSIRWRSPPSGARRPYGGGGIRQPSWLPAGHTPAGRSRTQSPVKNPPGRWLRGTTDSVRTPGRTPGRASVSRPGSVPRGSLPRSVLPKGSPSPTRPTAQPTRPTAQPTRPRSPSPGRPRSPSRPRTPEPWRPAGLGMPPPPDSHGHVVRIGGGFDSETGYQPPWSRRETPGMWWGDHFRYGYPDRYGLL